MRSCGDALPAVVVVVPFRRGLSGVRLKIYHRTTDGLFSCWRDWYCNGLRHRDAGPDGKPLPAVEKYSRYRRTRVWQSDYYRDGVAITYKQAEAKGRA